MKVKALKDLRFKRKLYAAGDELEMDKDEAEVEIERGTVEAVTKAKKAEEKKAEEKDPA